MGASIKVEKPLVILHGDEMAQIAFERILEQFVTSRLNIELIEVDLSAEQRELLTKFDQSLRGDGRAHTPREEGFFEGVRRFFAGR